MPTLREVMGKLPDDLDVMTQAKAALPDSFSIQDALGWLQERGIAEAIVFDEDGEDVGVVDVESLLREESLYESPRAYISDAFLEKYCPVDRLCMRRRVDEEPRNGKYRCRRHRVYHCEPACP